MPPVPPNVRNAVLGRLAAQETVSLLDATQASDEDFKVMAGMRCFNVFHDYCMTNSVTGAEIAERIVKVIQDARLTIAFKSGNWFYDENKYESYINMFQKGSSGASNDFDKRDDVENQMFQYGGRTNQVVPRGGTTTGVQHAQQRIQEYGVRNTQNFQAGMRSKYAAVDFGDWTWGASSKYGKSFFVLKDHMKHNATFVHRDSFELANVQNMEDSHPYHNKVIPAKLCTATFHTLERVVYFAELQMLSKLFDYAMGIKQKGSEQSAFGGLMYLEAHMHSDVFFKRDVAALHLSKNDVDLGPGGIHPRFYARWPNKKSVWDTSDARRTKDFAKAFAKRNNIKLVDIA